MLIAVSCPSGLVGRHLGLRLLHLLLLLHRCRAQARCLLLSLLRLGRRLRCFSVVRRVFRPSVEKRMSILIAESIVPWKRRGIKGRLRGGRRRRIHTACPKSTPISSNTSFTTSSPSSSSSSPVTSSIASSIISCRWSMMSFSFSNSIAIRCRAGRFMDRFIDPRREVAPFMDCAICSFERTVWMRREIAWSCVRIE